MIEVICNDRLGKKIRVKCNPDDTVGDLKKLLAAQIGTRSEKLRIQKWYTVYKTTSAWRTTRSTTGWASSCTTIERRAPRLAACFVLATSDACRVARSR